uniref:Catenin alpha-2 n=1 Tax=Molossus molossus TaxID=27622 RepID=A0A7J8E1M7_MOLMO|nr:catenin alpha 2 [Molossus molossus]
MVRAARALLSAVTRLLILADMADVMRLLSHLKIVEEALEAVKNATNEQDLANRFKEFGKEMVKLNYVAARRQQELKDPHCRDEMAAARGALKKNATMLANRDYVFKQVQEAIAGISNAAQATSPTDDAKGHTGIGELAAALNEFDNKIILDPMTFSEARFRPSLEERLESIISGAALMADSSCTRDDRRERIVAECNAVRQALQDLLSEYMNNVSPGPPVLTSRWTPARRLAALAALGAHVRHENRTGVPQR